MSKELLTVFRKRWYAFRRRCDDTNFKDYPYYGGKGITYEWKTFNDFYNDMYESFVTHYNTNGNLNTTLDRLDSNKNYSKDNCRWATRGTQSNNRSASRIFLIGNESLSMMAVSEKYGIGYFHLRSFTTYSRRIKYMLPICMINEFGLLRLLRKDQGKCLVCDKKYHCKGLCRQHYDKYYRSTKINLKKLLGSLPQ